uniref:SHSP domain-containing protein n=1 Tax=Brassica campestris TaxID=3711 RepID=M4DGW1_BRACM
MADTEMEEQDVASEDKTLTLDSDLHLPDAPIADVDQSEKKISSDGGQEESSSTPQVAVESVKKWKTWLLTDSEVDEAGRPEDQQAFIKEVEAYNKENFLDFKAPKFYGQPLNCLKLWRAVIKLGGYDVSLLEYEKHLRQNGELNLPGLPVLPPAGLEKEAISHQGSGSGRARRDAAARAMQGWHSQRLLESGDVTEPIVKDKGLSSTPKQKNLKNIGVHKQKTPSGMDLVLSHETDKQSIAEVIDVGPPADWVKITVRETKDCFEIFALIPGLLREEVRVQSDPAGRLVIAGQPEQLDNPWGITPFKKVVNFPARIDPLHTSAVVSLHGRLFVRVPFEQ